MGRIKPICVYLRAPARAETSENRNNYILYVIINAIVIVDLDGETRLQVDGKKTISSPKRTI